jgi:hypothetical protein
MPKPLNMTAMTTLTTADIRGSFIESIYRMQHSNAAEYETLTATTFFNPRKAKLQTNHIGCEIIAGNAKA